MQRKQRSDTRSAFTLVELIVVITIILIIAAITAVVLPSVLRAGKAARGASMIQGMLLAAKQRAIRDRTPAGVRFIITQDTFHAPSGFFRLICTEMAYVVQPDDIVVSGDSMSIGQSGNLWTATSTTQDFAGGMGNLSQIAEQFPVQAGDFLEVSGGGLVTAIETTGPSGSAVQNTLSTLSNPSNGFPVTDYRIIRMPRRVPGEDSAKLPADVTVVVADVPTIFPAPPPPPPGNPTSVSSFTQYTYYSLNIPARVVPFEGSTSPPATYYYEILFGPQGSVVGQGTASGDMIQIFVRDNSRDKIIDGEPVFVVVNPRTGAIGIQPVDATGAGYTYSSPYPYGLSGSTVIMTQPTSPAQAGYYTFVRDLRASGM
jgi:prepilin-type N-terminal cleavage/methylation domain-containing protein